MAFEVSDHLKQKGVKPITSNKGSETHEKDASCFGRRFVCSCDTSIRPSR
jgi:hypothetical protein